MTDLATALAPDRIVDLTQPLGPTTVLWPGSTPFSATTVSGYASDGSYARELALPEHAGTHLDAPSHFAPGGAHVDEIAVDRLVAPVVCIDARTAVANGLRELGAAIVLDDEREHGTIAAGSAVVVCTGWDAFTIDASRYLGEPLDFPGLGVDAARLLVDRGVVGIGIDTLGVDPGSSRDYAVHNLTLPAGLWQVEGLVGLDRLPSRGAWLVVGVIPVVAGSGAPARVIAILPTGRG